MGRGANNLSVGGGVCIVTGVVLEVGDCPVSGACGIGEETGGRGVLVLIGGGRVQVKFNCWKFESRNNAMKSS